MTAEFQHFILTRFNRGLYSKQPKLDKHGRLINPDQWMKQRLDLFRNFCFPSIVHQTCQNFKWLVFWDPQTPAKHLQENSVFQRYKNYIPIFGGSTVECVKKLIRPAMRHIITTRIDNDDAFQIRAIQIIQEQFHHQERLALNFPNGYCLSKNKLYLTRQLSNPFLTLIERVRWENGIPSVFTVSGRKHTELRTMAVIKQIKSNPMWLQIVHEHNLKNRTRGKPTPLTLANIRPWFGL